MWILFFLLLCSSVSADDKGYNVAVDKATGEIVELSYGDSGFQHRIDAGYIVLEKVPQGRITGDVKDMRWLDNNSDGLVQIKELTKKTLVEITSRKKTEVRTKIKKEIVELEAKKDKALALGYLEEAEEWETEIDELKGGLIP